MSNTPRTRRGWIVVTGAGPVITTGPQTPKAIRSYMQDNCPLTRKRGYTVEFHANRGRQCMYVRNSKGRAIHCMYADPIR